MSDLLAPDHVALLQHRAENDPDTLLQKRAQLLLLYHEGHPTSAVAREVGVAPSTARKWKQRYQSEGLAIFPDGADETPAQPPSSKEPPSSKKPRVGKAPRAATQAATPGTNGEVKAAPPEPAEEDQATAKAASKKTRLQDRVAELFAAVAKTTGKKKRLKKLSKKRPEKALKQLERMLKKRRSKVRSRLEAKKKDLSKKKRTRLRKLDRTLSKQLKRTRTLRKKVG